MPIHLSIAQPAFSSRDGSFRLLSRNLPRINANAAFAELRKRTFVCFHFGRQIDEGRKRWQGFCLMGSHQLRNREKKDLRGF